MAEIKIQSFLILEQTLTKRLVATWRKFSTGLITRIQKAIQREDWTRVDILIDEINFSRVLTSNKRFMDFIGRGAFLFGVARHDELKESKFVKDKETIPFLTEATENLQKIIAQQGDTFVKNNIRSAVATIKTRIEADKITKGEFTSDAILILKQRVKKAAKVRSNAQLLSNAVNGRTDQYLENVSSLHNSRLAGWGYVQEAEALGITTYRVSEQIDSDTICPICISMHGKEFQVSEARSTLEGRLTVDNLNDLQHIAPFPNQSKAGVQSFRNLSNPELVSSGFHVPPYHPRCRGLLVRSTDTANLGPLPTKARRRIPKPAPLPPVSRLPKNIAGLDKIDSDEVRRFFPDLVNSPAEARRALVKKRTTDMFTDAVVLRDAEILARRLEGRSPRVAATLERNFTRRAGDKEVARTINQLAEDYAESGMNPAILRNRPIARLHFGESDAPARARNFAGMYWPGLPDQDKLIFVRDFGNLPTFKHELFHHWENVYTRKTLIEEGVKVSKVFRPLGNLDAAGTPAGLKEAMVAMQKEFRAARELARDQLPKTIGGKSPKIASFKNRGRNQAFWNQHFILNKMEYDVSRRVSAYQLVNDREWLAEWAKVFYGDPIQKAKFKTWYPNTFKLMEDINKGKYLYADDVAIGIDQAARNVIKREKNENSK